MTRTDYLNWFGLVKDDPRPYFDKEKMAFVFDLFFCVMALAFLAIIVNVVLRNVFRIQIYHVFQDLVNAVIAKIASNSPSQDTEEAGGSEEERCDMIRGIIKDTVSPSSVEIELKPRNEASTALLTMRYDATLESKPAENPKQTA